MFLHLSLIHIQMCIRDSIQSAFEMTSPEKIVQEKKSLTKLNDFFKKIIVVKDDIKPNTDEQGIITVGIFDFLLNDNILEQI